MRLAAIDIGTNTMLLLVADVSSDGSVRPVLELQEIPRLGAGVDRNRQLRRDAMERAVRILDLYAQEARRTEATTIIACGTSALRDAHNSDEFLRLASERTGITVRILSGIEEAERTYAGTVFDLLMDASGTVCVVDIGGGSTEIVLGRGRTPESSHSFDIGAVRLTERHFPHLPVTDEGLLQGKSFIRAALESVKAPRSTPRLIAVAGTPVTLASILLQLPSYDPVAVHGRIIPKGALETLTEKLRKMSREEVGRLPQVQSGREDVLLAGGLILLEVMGRMGSDELQVSSKGLRYGIALMDGMHLSA